MIHVWGRGEWTNTSFSPLFFFFQLPRLNYVWYIKDHIGLMKSTYDFMSKICPWAPLKLTHMPSQQNWSGMLVGKRSCSCSLQRGEFELLVLKSTVLHSCSHHILLWKCQVMTLQRKQAPSVSNACALHAMLYSGKKEWSLQEAATLATASATPLLACMVRGSGWGRAGKALTHHSRSTVEGDLCQEKGRCTLTPHYSNWVSRTKLISCIITHPWIQCTASWD